MISFVETKLFTRIVGHYFSDTEYAELQEAMRENPELGAVIRGSGGVRKLRWRQRGSGKRGGIRVIYYAKVKEGVIWMLTLYAKAEAQSIPLAVLRQIKEEIDV